MHTSDLSGQADGAFAQANGSRPHYNPGMTVSRFLPAVAAATLLGCATTPLRLAGPEPVQLANHEMPGIQGPESCQTAIAAPSPADAPQLDPRRIDLFVWNIQKALNPDSLEDLERLAGEMDLVLIQEAKLEQRPVEALERARFWSFAPGYRTASASTGVMTLSRKTPLTHCYLTDREPWLRSPKAISVTEFGLESMEETLAVVNVHAVNFTLGVGDFSRQIAKIEAVLVDHAGPVILAGDFNTWRPRRIEILQQLTERLRLTEISFDVDHRITPLGSVVDRVFVRGLSAVAASTEIVDTSDHNPISITLSL